MTEESIKSNRDLCPRTCSGCGVNTKYQHCTCYSNIGNPDAVKWNEEKRKSIGTLTVDIDCSEALTGLKAIQREAKKATAALRELEEQQKRIRR